MKISVVIPTYRRADSLNRCLQGLQNQIRPPDEVVVVTRSGDGESNSLLDQWHTLPLRKLVCDDVKGAVSQYNLGLDQSQGDVIAVTDDDAVPRPDWLSRIERHFAQDDKLGGVGGRDIVYENGSPISGPAKAVGVVRWFGRIIHNHHLGSRKKSDVHILKGVNMSFKAMAIEGIRFDSDLRGQGAQTSLDLAFSLCVHKRGWRLLYDPELIVDHYPATRFDGDQRTAPDMQAIEDSSFNMYLTLRRHMRRGARRRTALLWAWSIGTERSPGWARGLLSHLRGDQLGIEMRNAARRAWNDAERY
ncbi:MAG TPA: glycosyltransferase family 2 protein [Candidatus Acidoferrales bacterium]|jgi:glycosyltransferase involved in cell wall biosynthesis|nr:glycosyltransferase family 2 protein [Candidatus Acidoferrales bacterium]